MHFSNFYPKRKATTDRQTDTTEIVQFTLRKTGVQEVFWITEISSLLFQATTYINLFMDFIYDMRV